MSVLLRNDIVSIILVLLCLVAERRKEKTPGLLSLRSLSVVLFSLYMVLVFSLTGVSPISGFHTDLRLESINLIPFAGIIRIASHGFGVYAVRNILGNILMFFPLGFFSSLLCPKKPRFWKATGFGLAVSLLIECTQLFLLRGTDVDDLLLNTLGAAVGCLVSEVFRLAFPKLCRRVSGASEKRGYAQLSLYVLIPYLVVVFLGFWDRQLYFAL